MSAAAVMMYSRPFLSCSVAGRSAGRVKPPAQPVSQRAARASSSMQGDRVAALETIPRTCQQPSCYLEEQVLGDHTVHTRQRLGLQASSHT